MVSSTVTTDVDNINNILNKNLSSNDKARAKAQANQEDFLKLLTTQLQNQDPTEPTDTNQLTEQIATLSQVEQQINTNNNLEKLINLFNSTLLNSVVGYIGKQIETEGDKGVLQNGKASFVYNLEQAADNVTVQILDPARNIVFDGNGTNFAGRNEVIWDGKDKDGNQLADGVYTLKVVAKDSSGDDIKSTTSTAGVVTSVDSKDGHTRLMLGDIEVELSEVNSVRQSI
ncbi:MAG: flagellar hook assembly protein FlgD [Rickettsiales bacterium]